MNEKKKEEGEKERGRKKGGERKERKIERKSRCLDRTCFKDIIACTIIISTSRTCANCTTATSIAWRTF